MVSVHGFYIYSMRNKETAEHSRYVDVPAVFCIANQRNAYFISKI